MVEPGVQGLRCTGAYLVQTLCRLGISALASGKAKLVVGDEGTLVEHATLTSSV